MPLRLLAAVLASAFAALAAWHVAADDLPGDRQALLDLHEAVGSSWNDAALVLSTATDSVFLALAALLVVGLLLWAGRRPDAIRFAVAVGVVLAGNPLLKLVFRRDRPELWASPHDTSPYAFPSGHAAGTAALVCAVLMVVWATRWLSTAIALGVVLLLLTAASRMVLGVHYPSDILAGWLWAGAWVAAVASTNPHFPFSSAPHAPDPAR